MWAAMPCKHQIEYRFLPVFLVRARSLIIVVQETNNSTEVKNNWNGRERGLCKSGQYHVFGQTQPVVAVNDCRQFRNSKQCTKVKWETTLAMQNTPTSARKHYQYTMCVG